MKYIFVLAVTLTFFQYVLVMADDSRFASVDNNRDKRTTISSTELINVPAGCFNIDGSQVCLDAFRIGKYVVTQGQYKRVMGINPSHFFSCGEDCPVEKVSWNDAQEFIKRLNNLTGKRYRLPTEAEWEYACHKGDKEEDYCGSDDIDAVAWYEGNSKKRTHPVGLKQPNRLGLYDMSGNVVQWVQDWEGEYPSGARNPTGPEKGFYRVFRSGSWNDEPIAVKATGRSAAPPSRRSTWVGFRLAESAP